MRPFAPQRRLEKLDNYRESTGRHQGQRDEYPTDSSETPDSSDTEGSSVSDSLNPQYKCNLRPSNFNNMDKSLENGQSQQPKVKIDLPDKILNFIPQYDGTNNTSFRLPSFIATLRELNSAYCSSNNELAPVNAWTLLKSAIAKISGPAELIVYNNEVNNIEELIQVLQNNFGDTRTIHDLLAEIPLMKSRPREHPISFLNRLIEKQAYLLTKYRTEDKYNDSLLILKEQLDMLLVNTLIHGIHPQLGSHLQVMRPNNLDQAHRILQNDCSILLRTLGYGTVNMLQETKRNQAPSPRYNYYSREQTPSYSQWQTPQPYSPRQSAPNNYNNHNYRQQFMNPNDFNHPFNKFNRQNPQQSKMDSQNTVSMRTVASHPKVNLRNFRSPYELTHINENKNDQMLVMKDRLDQLTTTVEKLSEIFLDAGSNPNEGPPQNLN